MRKKALLLVAGALVSSALVAGCAAIIGAASGTLSENLALQENGGVANKPLINDGNEFTSAKTGSPIYDQNDPNWMEHEKLSVAEVVVPGAGRDGEGAAAAGAGALDVLAKAPGGGEEAGDELAQRDDTAFRLGKRKQGDE